MAEYAFRKAVFDDVYEVCFTLSDVMRAEADALGLDRWKLLKLLRDQYKRSTAVYAILEDENPIAVFGLRKGLNNLTFETWLASSQRFFAGPSVLTVRRILEGISRRFPGCVFETISLSPHPQTDRWFRLLGYQRSGTTTPALYIYNVPPAIKRSEVLEVDTAAMRALKAAPRVIVPLGPSGDSPAVA